MVKECTLTGKKSNNGYTVSHSHIRTKKIQHINLQTKKIWSDKQKRWIKIKICTKAIKSLHKLKV
uniref:Large ribosomal subunit protein bL28c n=1 Tax=Gracilaria tenuistipitata var. liui TaxID=285951 RepID=RK28_GRATL|nr:ribosomal protein L28 [Gracilaria tenuistipitata var. liui]Q6B8P2.1 RecName: Full=Large ribosomal subunit protein bL28c; AltName: Full=50S ribosomal protein L28, chloroplastic [Gracilaria tenuistipitata var. liui]AAT79743.1 50S ribosomal protein L28 [Gracilaria tenuistipitata var. liui]